MIVTLSRQAGSEGDVIAARLAATLGLTLVDRESVRGAALAAGVPADLLQRLMYEGQRSLAAEIMDSLGSTGTWEGGAAPAANPLLGVFAPLLPPAAVSLEEAALAVGLIIKDAANKGNALVLGQGGQMWLRGYSGACHVQVVAPFELRVSRVAEREKIPVAAARRKVRASDQARSDYLARFHDVRWLDPSLYHLTVNTGLMSVEAALSLIIHAAQTVPQQS